MAVKDDKEVEHTQLSKKARLFQAKEFRNKLKTSERLQALQQFLDLCNDNQDHDYVLEYLESGGSCLELFQMLETCSDVPATLIIEILNHMLLQIISNSPQYLATTHEACRYFLNTHMVLVNKMLSLSASSKERKAILQLLSVMVAHSQSLAKDILLNIHFTQMNLEVLTKQTGQKDGVRNAFIHFVISFLIECHNPTISLLIEKKDILTSIMNDLRYDTAEIVCMVMTTLKNNILQNHFVSKTSKMSIFSTPVIKNIVNLYNWKGPEGFSSKKSLQTVTVDEAEKSQVNEAVHDFLLIACTSHTYGVIFKDHQLGTGKKSCNNLMLTVLESLEKPWEHSYAGELVARICGACPDLTKVVWTNLKQFLEPRATKQWFNAIKYVGVLVKNLQPNGIEFCIREFNAQQAVQIVQSLIAPSAVLKLVIPEGFAFNEPIIKHKVLITLSEILEVIRNYVSVAKNWFKQKELQIFRNLFHEYVVKLFPSAQQILNNWSEPNDDIEAYSVVENLEIALKLIDIYENMYPQLLENLNCVNLKDFLREIDSSVDEPKSTSLQVHVVKLFISFEPSAFTPTSELFSTVFPLILKFYFETKDIKAHETCELLLKNTGIFEDSLEEVNVWINSIFELTTLDSGVPNFLIEVLKLTSENLFSYLSEMSTFSEALDTDFEKQSAASALEALLSDEFMNEDAKLVIKQEGLSPLLLGTLKYLSHSEQDKNIKNYFNVVLVNLLHLQASSSLIETLLLHENYGNSVSKHVLNYVTSFKRAGPIILTKSKAHLAQDLCVSYFNDDTSSFFEKHSDLLKTVRGLAGNSLAQALFYFTNLNEEQLEERHLQNLEEFVRFCIRDEYLKPETVFEKIFQNPHLLQRFSVLQRSKIVQLSTKFLTDIIKEYENMNLHGYLKPLHEKLVLQVEKVLRKSSKNAEKHKNLLETLEIFSFESKHCLRVLNLYPNLPDLQDLSPDVVALHYNLLVYTLRCFMKTLDDFLPLDNQIVSRTIEMMTYLNSKQENFDTSSCAKILADYLETFPHHLKDMNSDLFRSILMKSEYCKENALLAKFLLHRRTDFLDLLKENLEQVATKKGLVLPLLETAIAIDATEDFLSEAYKILEPSFLKILQKPQKAAQHFETYKSVLVHLITKFLSLDVCRVYFEKVHKFEVSEPFHVEMLCAIFTKFQTEELSNAILTLVSLTNQLFKKKSNDPNVKFNEIVRVTLKFLQDLTDDSLKASRNVCENNNFQLYCKFCLKFGLSGEINLIKILKRLLEILNFNDNEAQLLLEMSSSHSEFLEILLNEDSECKTELLDFMLILFERWPALKERNHIPVFLAAYRATWRRSDRIILNLLQIYEKEATKTNFYDFKPFLWGTAAATHYSVRQNIQSALWRQPKMRDILDILEEERVLRTIANHPLDAGLVVIKTTSIEPQDIYDLAFFMPLFSSLLAPENEVAVYKFSKSGALSLTVAALASNDKEMRLSACHVLSRWYYHVEAKQSGRNRPLWLRYVEALCKGTAICADFKLNNFAAIFWAKMGLVLTQPFLPLYLPLSYYLGAKVTLNLNSIPELYTFLHDSNVNYKETRTFILEILRDGLRTSNDFSVALNAMTFKLIMELCFSSVINDVETRLLLLEIIKGACKIDFGRKMLCSNFGLLSWLYHVVLELNLDKKVLGSIILILDSITEKGVGMNFSLVVSIVACVIDNSIGDLNDAILDTFLNVVYRLSCVNGKFLSRERLERIISIKNDKYCDYLLKYSSDSFRNLGRYIKTDDVVKIMVLNKS